jgi:hypothetical protein
MGLGVRSTCCGDASPWPWVDGRKVGEVGEEQSAPGPGSSAEGADGRAATVSPGHEPVDRLDDAAGRPSHPPTEIGLTLPNGAMAPVQPATQTALPRLPPPDVPVQPRMVAAPEALVRYGPGVPATPPDARVELTAARAWRGEPPAPAHWRVRVRQILGSALTVILLAASGVLFYLRFHQPPLQVTHVAIVRSGHAGCTVAVAGQIGTNGASGTMTYQWLFPVGAPLTLHQSVSAGQHAVNVQVTVEGSGRGVALQRVWLQVVRPGRQTASKYVLVRCQ